MRPRPNGLRYESRSDDYDDCLPNIPRNNRGEPITLVEGIKFGDLLPTIQSHVNRDYENNDRVKDLDSPSWRDLPELPTVVELMPGDASTMPPPLPYNNIHTSWESKEQYLETHYRLLRADAICPMQKAVSIYRERPEMMDDRDVCIYTHVHIIGYTWANTGAAARIEFSYMRSGKRIIWKQSKRLQQGTLVALSPVRDKFRTICKVATVAARPLVGVEQNPPQIDLFWATPDDAEFDPSEEYIMLEARSGYFEASRHMLVAIQKLMTEEFPLRKPLIDSSQEVDVPQYLQDQPLMNLNSLSPAVLPQRHDLNNVDVLKTWPAVPDSGLDESQLDALKRILTKKVAVVQGPPGTGKTFVSICALKVMLENWASGDPPIIVAAQTNHALDQLLDYLKEADPDFLRIGGRTDKDNEDIIKRSLYEVRLAAPKEAQAPKQNFHNTKKALEAQGMAVAEAILKALAQDNNEIESLRKFGFLTEAQIESLNDEEWIDGVVDNTEQSLIRSWLGPEQIALSTGCPPMKLGFLEEEIDLDFEDLNEKEIEDKKSHDTDDIDALKGVWFAINEEFVGRSNESYQEGRARNYLKKYQDMYKIPVGARGDVYRYLRSQLKGKTIGLFRQHLKSYERVARNLKISKWMSDGYLIKRMGIRLIGCTTTGLSKYRGLLASLRPRTLLIEEAAETTEGAVLAAMYESVEQLILVGDHQQLQATCNIDYLAVAPYHLAVSMFERMVNNNVGYAMLNLQRRMVPELRHLLAQFYPALRDHPSVKDRVVNRPHVPGMGGRDSWFFQHAWPESRDESASRSNTWEADFICRFYEYLVFNDTKPSQITILTFYNGQRKLILNQLRKNPQFRFETANIKVFTVDSYQGEENDIILLSLVRNNEDHKIGFLDNPNRAVVSLSRARRGFYLFGNAINLLQANTKSFAVWGTVTDAILQQGRPDDLSEHLGLPVVCKNHNRQTTIEDPQDFDNINGGCTEPCGGVLECGHGCPHKCHPFLHSDVVCPQPCKRKLACGHGCSGRCGENCSCEKCYAIEPSFPPDVAPEEVAARTNGNATKDSLVRSMSGPCNPSLRAKYVIDDADKIASAHWTNAWTNEKPSGTTALTSKNLIALEGHTNGGASKSGPAIRDVHKRVVVDHDGRRRVATEDAVRHLSNSPLPSAAELYLIQGNPDSLSHIDRTLKLATTDSRTSLDPLCDTDNAANSEQSLVSEIDLLDLDTDTEHSEELMAFDDDITVTGHYPARGDIDMEISKSVENLIDFD